MTNTLTIRLAEENLRVDKAPDMRRRIETALATGAAVTIDLQNALLSAAYVRDALAPPLAAHGPDRLTFLHTDDTRCFVELASRYAGGLPDPNDPEAPTDPDTFFIVQGLAWNYETQQARWNQGTRLHLKVYDPQDAAWHLAATVDYADDAIEHADRPPTPGWTFGGKSFAFQGVTVHTQDITRNRQVAVSDPAFGRILRQIAEDVTTATLTAVDEAATRARQAVEGLHNALQSLKKGA